MSLRQTGVTNEKKFRSLSPPSGALLRIGAVRGSASLWLKPDASQQVCESWIRAQAIEPWLNFEHTNKRISCVVGLFQPSELIERGAEIDYREPRYDSTPLSSVVFYWDRPRMIEILSRVSRDVFSLAATGNLERLRMVLKNEPELAREARWGVTSLFRLPPDDAQAAEIVALLLECGTDPTIRNRDGLTAADCASEAGLDEAAELILSKLE